MDGARIGFCCTFVLPGGDDEEQRAVNMRQPTVAWPGGTESAVRLEETILIDLDTVEGLFPGHDRDVLPALTALEAMGLKGSQAEAKGKNLARADLAAHIRREPVPA